MLKIYESPSVELISLATEENLMNETNMSFNYGFSNDGPGGAVTPVTPAN